MRERRKCRWQKGKTRKVWSTVGKKEYREWMRNDRVERKIAPGRGEKTDGARGGMDGGVGRREKPARGHMKVAEVG